VSETRRAASYLFYLVASVLVVSLLLGQLLGQPVLLGFVETGSMEPTLSPGDGFVALPPALTGGVAVGDVVTFRAETLQGGGLTTHRVVGTRGDGFVTRGDANTVTDQASGEPLVEREQIVAEALQIGGQVVVIPGLGAAVAAVQGLQGRLARLLGTRALLGPQGVAYVLLVLGILSYVFTLFAESQRRARTTHRETGTIDGRVIVIGLTVLLIAVLTASSLFTSGTHTFEVVSSVNDAPGIRVIERGTAESVAYAVPSNGVLPVLVYLSSSDDHLSVAPGRLQVAGGEVRTARVQIDAPEETGFYEYTLVEHRYLLVLPPATIDALYQIDPALPLVATNVLFGGIFLALGTLLIGWGPVRIDGGRSRKPRRSLSDRIRDLFD
jgi:signal peptidase